MPWPQKSTKAFVLAPKSATIHAFLGPKRTPQLVFRFPTLPFFQHLGHMWLGWATVAPLCTPLMLRNPTCYFFLRVSCFLWVIFLYCTTFSSPRTSLTFSWNILARSSVLGWKLICGFKGQEDVFKGQTLLLCWHWPSGSDTVTDKSPLFSPCLWNRHCQSTLEEKRRIKVSTCRGRFRLLSFNSGGRGPDESSMSS